MNAEVTGADYVEAMSRDPSDLEYRRAFQQLVRSLVRPHGSVYDFGSGPGIDARCYANAGLRVGAYDANASMCEYFTRHCAAEIAKGSIRLDTGSYADFLGSDSGHGVDLIAANFAPLNLVADLPPLFAKFAAMLNADGNLLLSVLNPFFRELVKSRRWWTGLPGLILGGSYTVPLHGVIPVTRWLPGRLAQQAAPFFQLISIYAPKTTPTAKPPPRVRLSAPGDWTNIAATQFLFLQFQRRSGA